MFLNRKKNPNATLAGSSLPRQINDPEDELPLVPAPIKQRRGRPSKYGVAQTSAERVKAHRQHKADSTEQRRIDELAARLVAQYQKEEDQERVRKLLRTPEARAQLAAATPQEYEQWLETVASSVLKGRQRDEVTKPLGDLEKIFGAKSREGGVDEDSYQDSDRRKVKPEGFGIDRNSEINQEGSPASRSKTENLHWDEYTNKQATVERAKATREFIENSFDETEVTNTTNIGKNEDDEDDEDEGVSVQLRCKLPLYGQNAQCPYETEPWNTKPWDTARLHIFSFHDRELRKYLRQTLPAWMPGSGREGKLKKKPTAEARRQACPVAHQRQRQEAIERRDPFEVKCKCGHVIYHPAEDLPK